MQSVVMMHADQTFLDSPGCSSMSTILESAPFT